MRNGVDSIIILFGLNKKLFKTKYKNRYVLINKL